MKLHSYIVVVLLHTLGQDKERDKYTLDWLTYNEDDTYPRPLVKGRDWRHLCGYWRLELPTLQEVVEAIDRVRNLCDAELLDGCEMLRGVARLISDD